MKLAILYGKPIREGFGDHNSVDRSSLGNGIGQVLKMTLVRTEANE
jgi:hypothetical protein